MTMKKHILAGAAALMVAATLNLNAQESQALPFTRIDRNPRTSALAGAGIASVNAGAFSAFSGAAALSAMEGTLDAAFGLQRWMPGSEASASTNYNGAAAFRIKDFAVAVGGTYQKKVPFGSFTPTEYIAGLGLSYAVTPWLNLGLNARYAGQSLPSGGSLGGFSADLSVLGHITPDLSAAVALGCLGPKVQGSSASYPQPGYVRAGLAWNKALAQGHGLELLLDGEMDFAGALSASLGAEYNYGGFVFVRAGYRLAAEKAIIPSHAALGLGVKVFGVRIEASYLTASALLGNSLNLGLGYHF